VTRKSGRGKVEIEGISTILCRMEGWDYTERYVSVDGGQGQGTKGARYKLSIFSAEISNREMRERPTWKKERSHGSYRSLPYRF
jgi:hypothetical protein